jgi:hypothetical protein
MDPIAFAAARGERLESADQELDPFVRAALTRWGDEDWDSDLIEAASVLWLEIYKAEAPHSDESKNMAKYQAALSEYLALGTEPEHPAEEAQIDRVTRWVSTYTANDATWRGVAARGGRFSRWISQRDGVVREMHTVTDGQIRPIGGTFDVGGYDLHFPGEPVGPPEVWINCRCLIQPAARTGEAMSATTYTIGPEDDVLDDNPDVVPGSDVFSTITDPADIAVEPADEEELPDTDAPVEEPVHGVLAPEGVPTGDGREFAIGALSTRTLPVPLRYEIVGSHGGDTSQVVTVGRVDEAWRNDETNEWEFKGVVIMSKPHADEALAGIRDGSGRGVSIDGDDAEIQQEEFDEDSEIDIMEALFGPSKTVFSKMRVAGLTIVAIPAFQEAYIALGHDFREVAQDEREKLADEGAAMPDGSYPIANCEDLANAIQAIGRASDPEATKAHIKRRAAALSCPDVEIPEDWGAVLVASAIARMVKPESTVYPSAWFERPELDHPVPLRIDSETRRCFGYVAEWGVCHVGMQGVCQEVPRSNSNYGYYLKGLIDTDAGEQPVGVLSFGGHASRFASMAAASDYYDKPDAVRAFVNVGEDEFGVWFAGIVPPDVSDADIAKMRAIGAVSGDWREVRGQLELIGVPVVNTPGFPVLALTASAGRQVSLIGAGRLKPEPVLTAAATIGIDPELVAGIARTAVAEYRHQERIAARAEPLRQKTRQRRIEAARTRAQRG